MWLLFSANPFASGTNKHRLNPDFEFYYDNTTGWNTAFGNAYIWNDNCIVGQSCVREPSFDGTVQS